MASQSWLDTLEGAGRTLVPSTIENIKDMAKGVMQAVSHPVDTAKTVGQIGRGAASNAYTAMGGQPSKPMSDRARAEAVADAAWDNIAGKYSKVDAQGNRHFDTDTFKHTLATNPGGILADLSTVLPFAGEAGLAGKAGKAVAAAGDAAEASGATGAALRAARAAQMAGKGSQAVGRGITAVGKAANPLAAPIAVGNKVIPAVARATGNTPRIWQQTMSGAPSGLLKTAYQAGKASDIPLNGTESAGDVFKRFARGQGSTEEVQQTATRALNAARQEASDNYLKGKAGLSTDPVDLTHALDTIDKSDQALNLGSSHGFDAAKQAVNKARTMVEDVATNPKAGTQNIENADALKRQLWDLRNSEPNAVAKQHIGNIYNAVKDSINSVDPAYGELMDNYQAGLQNIQDLTKTLGQGQKTASTAGLAKMLRATKTPAGQDLLDQLSEREPALPFMLAGHAAQDYMPSTTSKLLDAGVLAGGYHLGPGALAAAGASALMSSPKLALGSNYYAGKAANALSKLPAGAKAVGDVIPSAETATALGGQLHREEENRPITPDEAGISPRFFTGKEAEPTTDDAPEEDNGVTPAEFFGAQPPVARASGGSVNDIEHHVTKLMNRAKLEKRNAGKGTEHLLSLPDNTIAKALEITKKGIV